MHIIFKDSINREFINTINTTIEDLLIDSEPYQDEKANIYLIEKEDIDRLTTKLSNTNREILNISFGMKYSDYDFVERNIKCHLVIINKNLCDELLLTFEEQIAVTLHELGHILNEFEIGASEYDDYHKRTLTDLMSGIQPDIFHKKTDVLFHNECYADYFAKAFGYAEQIQETLRKYLLDERNLNKQEEFEKRISELHSTNVLNGKIRVLRR